MENLIEKLFCDSILNKEEIILNCPHTGLLIEPMQWHEMYDFSEDCIVVVLANDHYNESDYIRNYSDFLTYNNSLA